VGYPEVDARRCVDGERSYDPPKSDRSSKGGGSGRARRQAPDVVRSVEVEEKKAVVLVQGNVDASNGDYLLGRVDGLLDAGITDITIDMERVTFADSAGLRAVTMTSMALADAGRFLLRNPSPIVRRVIALSGLGGVIPTEPPWTE